MDTQPFEQLERKLDDLIQLYSQLDQENRTLKTQASSWQHEREQLLHKVELARSKVDAMIIRLKALEQES